MRRRLANTERDAESLIVMHRQSWRINFPGRRFEEWAFRASLERGIADREMYLYEEDGDLLAWLWLAYPRRSVGHVRHIQVAAYRWGQGIGRTVMYDAIRMCANKGCQTLTLVVTKSNLRAMALYESLGFVITRDQGPRQRMALDLEQAVAMLDGIATSSDEPA